MQGDKKHVNNKTEYMTLPTAASVCDEKRQELRMKRRQLTLLSDLFELAAHEIYQHADTSWLLSSLFAK